MKRIARVPALLLTVISIPLILTCNLLVPVDWSDYADVNMIEATQLAITTPPTWAADWDAPYMLFEEVTDPIAIGAAPPAELGSVFRLEILNLMPNGTFDTGTAPWANGFGTPSIAHDPSGALDISFSASSDLVEFAVADLLDSSVVAAADVAPSYIFRTRMNSTTSSVRFEYFDGQSVDGDDVAPVSWVFDTPFAGQWALFPDDFPIETAGISAPFFSPTDPTGVFGVGTRNSSNMVAQIMTLDEFRVIRADIPLGLRLSVPYSAVGRPDLPSGGTYFFEVWARTDPTAGVSNRIAARAVSFRVTTRVGERSFPVAGATSWSSHEVGDDWTRYVGAFSGITFQHPAIGSDPVLELVVTPTQAGGQYYDIDAGSLLIAAPSLTWDQQ